MNSTFVSLTDADAFHLTIFSTSEFLSQLAIIYGHIWNWLTEKTFEAWVIESNFSYKNAI
ncbi:MAG: hypothetical protein F6K22_01270 [Okeania sp. SIO2F4]|uniref:hypothetical protein n=1 Tax=Okeania sp. SIO2F4 TaxID=2607790 RepID=UPI00142A5DB8|nr:hypothetical protein [Okeania sp. SIO2F4]NES01583.1 hypothetical protein [Okeania sp. SIO2F4]